MTGKASAQAAASTPRKKTRAASGSGKTNRAKAQPTSQEAKVSTTAADLRAKHLGVLRTNFFTAVDIAGPVVDAILYLRTACHEDPEVYRLFFDLLSDERITDGKWLNNQTSNRCLVLIVTLGTYREADLSHVERLQEIAALQGESWRGLPHQAAEALKAIEGTPPATEEAATEKAAIEEAQPDGTACQA